MRGVETEDGVAQKLDRRFGKLAIADDEDEAGFLKVATRMWSI